MGVGVSVSLYLNEPVVPVLVPAVTETINPVAEPDANWPKVKKSEKCKRMYGLGVSEVVQHTTSAVIFRIEGENSLPSTHAILAFVSLITGLEHAVDPILTDSAALDEPKPDPTTVTVTAPAVG